jgi:hypothetical protein
MPIDAQNAIALPAMMAPEPANCHTALGKVQHRLLRARLWRMVNNVGFASITLALIANLWQMARIRMAFHS